ncbi:thioredoxin [Candidatus Bathyarchaeota archaeon]|nr:thioredoxin [Candidatus Bathyarchaeota archaeon]
MRAKDPVLVDFYADWCKPCNKMEPSVEKVAEEYQGRVEVGKVNTDDCPKVAQESGVKSIPTLVLFKNGRKVDQEAGARPKDRICEFIDRNVS